MARGAVVALVAPASLCAVVVLAASCLRGAGKWVRIPRPQGRNGSCWVHTVDMRSEDVNQVSPVCCPALQEPCDQWTGGRINRILASIPGAISFPLVEPAASVAVSLATNGPTTTAKGGWTEHPDWRRLGAAASLVVVRTTLFAAKSIVLWPHFFPDDHKCWYNDMSMSDRRPEGKCSETRDVSDHIFLCLVQFLAPVGLSAAAAFGGGTTLCGRLRMVWVVAATAACVLFAFQTAWYYHTADHNVAAVAVAAGVLWAWNRFGLFALRGAGVAGDVDQQQEGEGARTQGPAAAAARPPSLGGAKRKQAAGGRTREELNAMTADELRRLCRRAKLPASGVKAALVERLLSASP